MTTILQLFDIAGIGSLYSKLLRKAGHRTLCIYYEEADPYRISEYYQSYKTTKKKIPLVIAWAIIRLRPQIIHLHYHQKFIFPIKLLAAIIRLKCKIIFQFHGSNFRSGVSGWIKYVDHVIVVSPDLHFQRATLLINPVDQDLFFRCGNPEPSTALSLLRHQTNIQILQKYCDNNHLKLTAIDEIDFVDLARLYRKNCYYLDMKGFYFPVLSKSALEALSCGAKVVVGDADNYFIVHPDSINIQKNTDNFLKFYEVILNEST